MRTTIKWWSLLVACTILPSPASAECVQPLRPIALVHGIRNDGTSWDNTAVKQRVSALGSSALLQPSTLWRQDVNSQALTSLEPALAAAGVLEGTTVGYSLGGVLGREYLRATYPASRTKMNISIGSMHLGAPILNNLQQYRLPAAMALFTVADIALMDYGSVVAVGEGAGLALHDNAPAYAAGTAGALLALTELLFVRDVAGSAMSNDLKSGSSFIATLNATQAYEADVTRVGIVCHESFPQVYRMAGSASGVGKSALVSHVGQIETRCLLEASKWLWAYILGSDQYTPGQCFEGFVVWASGSAALQMFPYYWNSRLVGSPDNDGVVPAYSQVYPGGLRSDVYDCNHLEETNHPVVADLVATYVSQYGRRHATPPPMSPPSALWQASCSATTGPVLAWQPVPTATGYRIYRAGVPVADLGNVTSYAPKVCGSAEYGVAALRCDEATAPTTAQIAGCAAPPLVLSVATWSEPPITGQWNATTSGGCGGVTLQWEYRYVCFDHDPIAPASESQAAALVVPCGVWYPIQTNGGYLERACTPSQTTEIRCTATSGAGETASWTKVFSCTPSLNRPSGELSARDAVADAPEGDGDMHVVATSSSITVRWGARIQGLERVSLHDLMGRRISSQSVAGANRVEFSARALAPGMYLVRGMGREGAVVRRVMLVR